MSNVIQFPTKMVRDMAALEKFLKEMLAKGPIDKTAQEELLKRFLSISEKFYREFQYNISFSVPSSVSDAEIEKIKSSLQTSLQEFHKIINDHFQVMIREMWTYESKLYLNEL